MSETLSVREGAVLPESASGRWQPLRGGLLNLYRYDYQEFRYEGGRLVLRGNNGTGKSRVLALQLPFLLDGEISPQRVEPDGDSAKRMEWNLLMGGKYDDRLGYSWLEFGRLDEERRTHYQTIGCALRAVQGRGIAQQWFFMTPLRIGRDLFLQNEQGQPLSKAKLEIAIGDNGRVFGSGKVEDDRRDYRRAVDQALFQLGERYEALLNLLIQLRQPQLSRKLNEQVLSDALSQALPPLPDAVLGDVADAFRSLDADRQELADFIVARDSSDIFLKEYRRYIQVAALRRAGEVRSAQLAYENAMRRLRETMTKAGEAEEELQRLAGQIASLGLESERAVAAEAALRSSPEMKSAEELEAAGAAAVKARKDADATEGDVVQARSNLAREGERQELAKNHAEKAASLARSQLEQALQKASLCSLGANHREAVANVEVVAGSEEGIRTASGRLNELLKQRFDGIRVLESLNADLEKARQAVVLAQESFSSAEKDLEKSIERHHQSLEQRDSEILTLGNRYQTWFQNLTVLAPAGPEEVATAFGEWCEAPNGESPLAKAIQEAERKATQALATLKAEAQTRLQAATGQLEELRKEKDLLSKGHEEPPPCPYTRAADCRENALGAPLWALCDFQPELPLPDRAGIEAALESAGLLDAWVTPDGRLLSTAREDSVLVAGSSPLAPEGASLAVVLKPDPSAFDAVPETVIKSVLDHIGFGPGSGDVWVNSSGDWKMGPLHGRWRKPEPQYIGQASREAARQKRLAEIESELSAAQTWVETLKSGLEKVELQFEQLRQEMRDGPSDGPVRQSFARISDAQGEVNQNRSRLSEREGQLSERRRILAAASEKREAAAEDLNLKEWTGRLEVLKDLFQDYRLSLVELWAALRSWNVADSQFTQANERLAQVREQFDSREARNRESQGNASAAEEKYRILKSTVGASVDEILNRLQTAKDRSGWIKDQLETVKKNHVEKATEKAILETKIGEIKSDLEGREQTRGVAIAGLIRFAGTRQLSVAHETWGAVEA